MLYFEIGDNLVSWNDEVYPLKLLGYMREFLVWPDMLMEEQIASSINYRGEYHLLDKYKNNKVFMENIHCKMYNCGIDILAAYRWEYYEFGVSYWLSDLKANKDVHVCLHPELEKAKPLSADRLFSIIGLHSMFLHRDAVVLHASYIEHKGKAILFTAPSQTGKSTQASLWEKYENAELINGDRVLLRQRDGVWFAHGYPCCGSSDVCVNRSLPIEAIVVLEQAHENTIRTMTLGEKIRALTTAMEVYVWDSDEVDKAFLLAERLVQQVTVCKLSCKPDAEAVQVLKKFLEGNP